MKKLLYGLIFAAAFLIGATSVFVAAAIFLEVDVFGVFVTSASRAVGIFGEHFPQLHTRFGNVQIKTRPDKGGQRVDISCTDCQLVNKVLSSTPLTTPQALLEGSLVGKEFTGQIEVEGLKLNLNALWDKNNVTGKFVVPKSDISSLYHAVRTIVPEAESATISGQLNGKGKFSWPKFYFLFEPEISGFTVDGLVDANTYKHGKFEYEVENKDGARVRRESGETTNGWVNLEQVGRYLPSAIMALEDRGFYQHPGYDLESMIKVSADAKYGERTRGASTITQQLAKNLFLTDEHTYARKLRELLYTVEMERELGKKRIIELYMNIVEWGPDIYGAAAAARIYFNKVPSELLPEEAAWMASILNNPKTAYKKQYLTNSPNSKRTSIALGLMSAISDEARNQALSRPIHFAKQH